MSGDVQLELWLHEYEMSALSSVLEKQGTTVEKRMQEMLIGLYAELVPHEEQQEIRSRLDAECAAAQTAEEAAGSTLRFVCGRTIKYRSISWTERRISWRLPSSCAGICGRDRGTAPPRSRRVPSPE